MVYDGVPTASITLDALRSNVTIIPQVVRNILILFSLLSRTNFYSPSS